MAEVRISDLQERLDIDLTDFFAVDNATSTRKLAMTTLLSHIADDYQTQTDNSLETTDKTVVGAINELNTNKAAKTDAIKNITRNGTTFTATRADDTTFTFTQQDNNTTTGTTYTAGNVPNNTTFGTNGSIKNSYDALITRTTTLVKTVNSGNYSITAGAQSSHNASVSFTAPAGYTLVGLFDVQTSYSGYVREVSSSSIGSSYSSNTTVSANVCVANTYSTSLTFTGYVKAVFVKNI